MVMNTNARTMPGYEFQDTPILYYKNLGIRARYQLKAILEEINSWT